MRVAFLFFVFQFTPLREGRRPAPSADQHHQPFQFTPLREGRRRQNRVRGAHVHISIHAPPRGATYYTLQGDVHMSNFNSRPSARGDSRPAADQPTSSHFNSRPSARGDQAKTVSTDSRRIFQFTPLREGRPRHREPGEVHHHISIHAPPRGATEEARIRAQKLTRFQFTPLREGRQKVIKGIRVVEISIHAPPRGATTADSRSAHPRFKFQFTPLREGRPERAAATSQGRKFQFTPLREGRHGIRRELFVGDYFNSRPSARGDATTLLRAG